MGASVSQCLDEDEVLAFTQGELASQRRSEVLAHVDGCETCRALAAAVARVTTSSRPPEPPPDRLIDGRYRLLGAIGRGATATVFRARDEKLGIDVALKAVHRTAYDAKGFARELKVGRRITNPNVCRLYDAAATEDLDYITMELVDGDTLAHVLAREELSLERALEVLDAVAAGLAAAHEQNIVHRDLKPANIMIENGTNRVVLMDFGFATQLDANQSRRLVGTPAYWSPEQARGETATPASDVYSFGVLAYRLLASYDFKLSDPDAIDRVPRAYRRAVARCVASSPGDRFRDAGEVRAAFRAASGGRPSRRRGLQVAFLGGAALVAWAVLRSAPPAGTPSGPPATASAGVTSASAAVAVAVPTAELSSAAPEAHSSAVAASPAISASASATGPPAVHPPSVHAAPPRPPASSRTPPPKSSEGDLLYVR